MTAIIHDPEALTSIFLFLLASSFAVAVVIARQLVHERRLMTLELVDQLMEDAFDSADLLLRDKDTPPLVKRSARRFCRIMGRRDVAQDFKTFLKARKDGNFSDGERSKLKELRATLQTLAKSRKDLLDALNLLSGNSLAATMLRWPETEALGWSCLNSVVRRGQDIEDKEEIGNIEERSRQMYSVTRTTSYQEEPVAA